MDRERCTTVPRERGLPRSEGCRPRAPARSLRLVRLDSLRSTDGPTVLRCASYSTARACALVVSGLDDGADLGALADAEDVALLELEDADGHFVFAAERHGRGVHDADLLGEELIVGEARVHARVGEADRIAIVDALDLGGLEEPLRLDLHGA